jgi:wyosine [tRNA(Phe)-imidazoG37] synthetase (radical SAM superfamily)
MNRASATIPLQQGILYGPVRSRRLGLSLGLNLLPDEIKVCSMNCGYCQYSWTGMLTLRPEPAARFFPGRDQVREALRLELVRMGRKGTPPDTLTFSGNGEATLHPEFPEIARDVVALRDEHAPGCRTAILSNSTTLGREEIRRAILLLDDPVLKLDTGREETFRRLNRPAGGVRFDEILAALQGMGPKVILQSLFVRGALDNTTEPEISAWIAAVAAVRPRLVQIYTLDRGPADQGLSPVPAGDLKAIAARLRREAGVEAACYA